MTVSGFILDILGAPVLIWSELSNEASRIRSGAVIRGTLKARERMPVWIAEKIGSKAHRGNGCFAHYDHNKRTSLDFSYGQPPADVVEVIRL